MQTVLLIEDEPSMRRMLRGAMQGGEYALSEAVNGEAGLKALAEQTPDIVLLDLGLPDLDGVTVTKRIRQRSKVPIIVLSARGLDKDKIEALDAGADDYLTKPFSVPELFARIRVATRRRDASDESAAQRFQLGDVVVDLEARLVTKSGADVKLTPIEFSLLSAMLRKHGRVLTHQHLLGEVWGLHSTTQKQYLHVYVGHLRSKLESDPARPKFILTEPGVGYRLRIEK